MIKYLERVISLNNLKLEISAITNKGNGRKHNEDNFFLNDFFLSFSQADKGASMSKKLCSPVVAGVCDGMGGEKAGEEASLLVVSSLFKCISKRKASEDSEKIRESIKEINGKVCETIPGSGATLAMVYANSKKITAASIGDSRIYLYSHGKLKQLTTDHTLAQMQVESGLMDREQAKNSKLRHVLTQHIGIPPEEMVIEPDIFEIEPVSDGDIVIVCSDGLTDAVDEIKIKDILSEYPCTSSATEQLVNCALDNSGKDNMTVMAIKVNKE